MERDGPGLGARFAGPAADAIAQDGFARVLTVGEFGHLAALPLVPDKAVVLGELLDVGIIDEVESGIADVSPKEVIVTDPRESEGGTHAASFVVFFGEFAKAVVCLAEKLIKGLHRLVIVAELRIEGGGIVADAGHEEP